MADAGAGANGGETGKQEPAATLCASTTTSCPPWDIGAPKPYVYEDRVNGELEDDGASSAAAEATDDEEDEDVNTAQNAEAAETTANGEDGTADSGLTNMWTNLPASKFKLRGPGYLAENTTNNTKLKVPSASAAYSCVGLNVFIAKYDLRHAAEKVASLKQYLATRLEEDAKLESEDPGLQGDAPPYLIYSWVFSNFFKTEYTAVVHVCRRAIKIDSKGEGEDPKLDKVFSNWLAASDEEKSAKLKYCPQFSQTSTHLLKTIDALGGQRPVIIGKKLTASYYRGENYVEIDLDVGSSTVASMLNGIALKSSGHLVVDEAVCIEGQSEEELPERALFAVRWDHCSIADCGNTLNEHGDVISS
ncbi:Protein ENHANCED DISEASE RESISTANCE 2-like [Hondaea fermentalgiana]|uniref:Protein ENHANCED DISEASE RESISTANCE 2-like n=1 Tax=Hondaea fermentalgiana TaxID=2315210 RepID=A0A2R5GET5_9STRA|nr:Protein ENHANCED DISEASE RESISTANCE 2-like [Hondaea fermentalgiana]|eukprot:GBG29452.1 Protein ENHANCED DISEASE RESISTANCE 2-like [Hondaea fermentalgiana]